MKERGGFGVVIQLRTAGNAAGISDELRGMLLSSHALGGSAGAGNNPGLEPIVPAELPSRTRQRAPLTLRGRDTRQHGYT